MILKLFGKMVRNWKAKLVSLIIASIFYVNLQNSKVLIKTINVPIDYPKLSGNLSYSKNPEKTIPVRVEGLKDVVNYYSQFMKAVIDPEDVQLGVTEVPIKKIVGVPSGVKVTKLKKTVPVEIESRGLKVVPLEVVFEGNPPPNFEKLTQILSPQKITLSGKPQDLEKINKVVLPEISLVDRKEPFAKTVKIPELPKGVGVLGSRDVTVNVNIIPLSYKTGEQTAAGIPIVCSGLDPKLDVELSEEQVAIRYFSLKPIRSAQILTGITAQVPCNYIFDPIKNKIIPELQPQIAKVRIIKNKDLKGIEILQISPEKIEIRYKVKDQGIDSDPTDDGTGMEGPGPDPSDRS
ncbi:CdaR family protein [Leptospira jelokensis]|uniref:YbbR-like domain-containing protein n=1 Tax=Leptospira jelokensis TaxID=2484931 RepID=A0A4Z0ZYG8_9LEPT|nr:YbbR-like domain-containing protein [Leptospira jelokensis]TGL59933.1 YbbR-like domain-containing protein [Leptospira jelokensis]TGM01412.1 YbbR-like domain-containing protein [Leptospira jelokensis]